MVSKNEINDQVSPTPSTHTQSTFMTFGAWHRKLVSQAPFLIIYFYILLLRRVRLSPLVDYIYTFFYSCCCCSRNKLQNILTKRSITKLANFSSDINNRKIPMRFLCALFPGFVETLALSMTSEQLLQPNSVSMAYSVGAFVGKYFGYFVWVRRFGVVVFFVVLAAPIFRSLQFAPAAQRREWRRDSIRLFDDENISAKKKEKGTETKIMAKVNERAWAHEENTYTNTFSMIYIC